MRRVLKWAGIGLGSVLGLVVVAGAAVYLISNARMNTNYSFMPETVAVPTEADRIAWGEHVLNIRGCQDCHGEGMRGQLFIDGGPIGQLYASNLTSGQGGVAGDYVDDRQWVRAIRHGIGADGKPLLFMPSYEYNPLSDEDVGAMIAFIKQLPPVDNVVPASTVGPLGRALFLAGQFPLLPAEMIDHEAPRSTEPAPEPGPTAAYGEYLAHSCTGCHGPGFSGGAIPGVPPEWPEAANLTPDEATGLGNWQEADFFRLMREGIRPDGRAVDPAFMPWTLARHMSDDEVRALWLFLETLPAKAKGGR